LYASFGLDKATDVMLTGCSAGGLATFLHTDYVGKWLNTKLGAQLKRYKSVPISGLFLHHNTSANEPVYPAEIDEIYTISEASNGGLNDACVASFPNPRDAYRCNFAEYAYRYTTYPIFPLNSMLDSWQVAFILNSVLPPGFPNQTTTDNGLCDHIPGWNGCPGTWSSCTGAQQRVIQQYQMDFTNTMRSQPAFNKAGNGAYIDNILSHCEGQGGDWDTNTINGVSMHDATLAWWNSDPSTPATQHTHICTLGYPQKCA